MIPLGGSKSGAAARFAAIGLCAVCLLFDLIGCTGKSASQGDKVLLNIVALEGIDPMTQSALAFQVNLVRNEPGKAQPWGALGVLLKESDFTEESAACFARAADLEPKNPKWPYLIGWSQMPAFPDRAIAPLKKAVQLAIGRDPDHPVALLRLAEAYQELGEAADERALLESIPSGPPYGDFAQLRLGELDWQEGRDQSFQERVKKIPERPNWSRRLALLKRSAAHLSTSPQDGAQNGSGNAADPSMERDTAPAEVAWIDPFVQETRPARQGLKRAFQQAWAFESRGQIKDAAEGLESILSFTKDPRAYAGLIRCKLKSRPPEEAEAIIKQARTAFPDHLQIFLLEGECELAKGINLARIDQWGQAREVLSGTLAKIDQRLKAPSSDPPPTEVAMHTVVKDEAVLSLCCRLEFWLNDKPRLLADATTLLQLKPGNLGAKAFAAWARQSALTPEDLNLKAAAPVPSGAETYKRGIAESPAGSFPETAAIIRRISLP